MSVTVTFLGHAAFLLSDGTHEVVIDPFLTGNPVASHEAGQIGAKHIVLTHGHEDHFGDTLSIAKANDATVYAAYEICNFVSEQGHEKCQPGNPGGCISTEFGHVAFTQAFHSSSYQGRYMGMPCGAVVRIGGKTVYHLGDTALFSDLKLMGELHAPDIALVPVGDRFTMGPEHGTRAAELVGAPLAVPMHYNTWPPIEVDVSAFKPHGIEARPLQPGQSVTV